MNTFLYCIFSNHEIGIYDVPNFINFALNTTKQENLYFVGYSEGTTVYFIMISELPEYNKKIRISIILAPVTYTSKNFFPVGRLFGGTVDINHVSTELFKTYICSEHVRYLCTVYYVNISRIKVFLNLSKSEQKIPKSIELKM